MPTRSKSRNHSKRKHSRSYSRSSHGRHSRRRERSRKRSKSKSVKKYDKDKYYNKTETKPVAQNKADQEERLKRKARAALLLLNLGMQQKKKDAVNADSKEHSADANFSNSNIPSKVPIPSKSLLASSNNFANCKEEDSDATPKNEETLADAKMDVEEDPLESYLNDIKKDAIEQKAEFVDKKPENKVITLDDIINSKEAAKEEKNEEEDYHSTFMKSLNKILNPEKKEKTENKENAENQQMIIYQEDQHDLIDEYKVDDTEAQWRKLKENSLKGKELKPVDHSKINYPPFKKDFYIEPSEISSMTDAEVIEFLKQNGNIRIRGKAAPRPIFNWYHCGLSSVIMEVLKQKNIKAPFPIQMEGIPAIMSGRDIIGIAETGSGKTLAYVLPMLRHVLDQPPLKEGDGPIALILVPTRELAVQIYQEVRNFTKYLNIDIACVYGGTAIGAQIGELKRGREIVVATPGRLIEILCLSKGKITNLQRVTFVVLDEADRMFDLGFEPQISKILDNIRPDRQTSMFTATFPKQIESLAKRILNKPLEIVVGLKGATSKNVEQHVEVLPKSQSFIRLLQLLQEYSNLYTIIFADSQEECIELWKQLFKQGFAPVIVHGAMDQEDRLDAIEKFKKGESKIFISTSISSRGLDFPNCGMVVNFRCPNHMEDYIHRIGISHTLILGRTGRGLNKGVAFTFISEEEDYLAEDILKALEISEQEPPDDLKTLVRNYQDKVNKGEAERVKISGYLGRGYQFNSNENEQGLIERKLIASGYENDIDEKEINKNKERLNQLHLLNQKHKSKALVLKQPTLKEKYEAKMKSISKDIKARQIALDVGMNAAKAAIIAGKNEEETLALVHEAITKALDNYKPSVTVSKGVETAIKIIDEWEYKENTKNHIYTYEFDINDYPLNARKNGCKKEFLKSICDLNDVEIYVKGNFIEPGKKNITGLKKLHLLIKGKSQNNVNSAFTDLKRSLDEMALEYYTSNAGYTGNTEKYNI